MTDAPTVAVRGEAVSEVEPELATLTVTVTARDADRERTVRLLAERTETLRGLLAEHAEAIERRETSQVHVYPQRRELGERVRAYEGSVSTTVTFCDFSRLGDILLTLADQDQTSVYGPVWTLRPDSPAFRAARRAAIGDALDRARDYADALGARLVRLVELTDSGLSGERAPQPMVFAMQADGGQRPPLELDPQRQTVRATVEARFAISEPDVLGRQAHTPREGG